MARKRRYDEEAMKNSGSVGYSDKALKALETGIYGQKYGRQAQYRTSQEQTQQAKELPVLEGMTRSPEWKSNFSKSMKDEMSIQRGRQYQQNLAEDAKNYQFNKSSRKANSLDADDMKYLQKFFDEYGDSARTKKALYESKQTQGWEQKYGKSYDQIYKDFLADQNNVNIEKGANKPLQSLVESAFGILPQLGATAASEIGNLIDPDSEFAKKAEALRHNNEVVRKQKRKGVEAYAKSRIGVADNLLGSPESLQGAKKTAENLVGSAVNTANQLSDRMLPTMIGKAMNVPGMDAVMSGLSDVNTQLEDLRLRPDMGARQQAASALAHGGVEGAGTAITMGLLDKIPAVNGVAGKLLNVGKGAGNGAVENTASEWIEQKLDNLINGELSKQALTKDLYMAQGMSAEDAEAQAKKDSRGQILNAAGTGAAFGGLVKGIGELTNSIPVLRELTGKNEPDVDKLKESGYNDVITERGANNGRAEEINQTGNQGNIRPEQLIPGGEEAGRSLDGGRTYAGADGRTFSLRNVVDENLSRRMDEAGINNFGLRDTSGQTEEFSRQLAEAKANNANGRMVDAKTPDELANSRLFSDDARTVGVAVEPNGNIVAVHKNPSNTQKGAVDDMLITARANGGDRLDCYGRGLVRKYEQDGFVPVARVEWNEDFKPGDWGDNPPEELYVMMRDPRSNEQVIDDIKNGTFRLSTPEELDALPLYTKAQYGENAYTEALKYRDSLLERPTQDALSSRMNESTGLRNPTLAESVGDNNGKVRSFSKRGSMDETLPDEIRYLLAEDYYNVVRNADTEARANSLFVPDNLTQTRSNLDRAVEAHDPAAASLSYKLAKAYVDNGDYDAATDVLQNVSAELTRMGQFTQAAKLAMLQNDPMAAMRSYMRDLEKLNQWGKQKYKGKWNDLELSQEDMDMINSIQKGDSEGLNAAFDALNEKFSKEIPASWWDKAVSASKTAMLLNLRTQSRNILANVASLPLRSASDRVAALGQNIAHLINDDVKVTQSLTGGTKAQKDIAGQIFDRLKDNITGENKMKDSVKSDILSQRQIFKDDFFAKWLDNLTDGGIQRLNEKFGANGNQSTMETLANLTYWLMGDVGDTPFVKKNFVNRLASYMKAQGIDNIDDVPDEAISLATQEALKATFKDDNAFSKALQGVKQKSGKFGEIALPFVKTPANLTMRAIDYSPAGLINTFRKIKSGADASAVIDDLSKNLTGTALIYLGYKLAENGLLSGSYSSDPDEAEFQKQQGMLENAIHVGDNYYTYDWTQPASTPLLLGQTIYEAVKASDSENASVKDIINATYKGGLKVANTIINSSPLQSLSDLLGDSQYGDEGVAENIANEIMEFPQRFIPSVVGATARVVDPTIRDTYIKDTSLTGALGNQARSAMAKIPFLSKTLPASYDTWGNERTRSDSQGEAFFAQMVNPGQLGNKNETPLDSEIQRIYDATGNSAVFPLKADRSYNLGNDGNITLTNKQHSDFQKAMGQRSYSYAESIMNNPEYKNLADEDKAAVLEKAYKLSNALTKEEMFDHVTDSDKKLKEIARSGNSDDVAKFLIDKALGKDEKSQNTAIKEATNLSSSSNAAKMIKADLEAGNTQEAEQKIDEATQMKNLGFTKPNPTETYYKAKNIVPSLTVDEFAKTYKAIDADGNQGIKQDELIAYFNNNHFTSEAEAMKVWNIYAPKGKKVPYIKKDGTWGKH